MINRLFAFKITKYSKLLSFNLFRSDLLLCPALLNI